MRGKAELARRLASPAVRRRRSSFAGILALSAAVGGAGCAPWPEPTTPGAASPGAGRQSPDDADLAALVPAGVQTVIELDLDQLRRSPFTAEALANPDAVGRERSALALGFDATADLDRVVYATGGVGPDAPTLVIAQGRIRYANVEAAFRERHPGATADAWHGLSVLASGENALAALTPKTFVSGPPGQVRAAIDRAFGLGRDFRDPPPDAGNANARGKGQGRRRDPGQEHGQDQGVVRRDLLGVAGNAAPAILITMNLDEGLRARVGDALPLPRELRTVGLRLDLGESLDLRALGLLDDRDAAAVLARRLAALLAARDTRQALGTFGLGSLVEGAKVAAEGARVRIATTVGPDQRTALAAALRALATALRTGTEPRP
jgi:hypothetical protein